MNKKLTVAYFIDSINSISGTEKQLLSIIANLNKDEYNVILICLRKPIALFDCKVKNFKYVVLNVENLLSFRSIFILIKTARYLRRNCVDIVQSFFIDGNIFGTICAKLANVKLIIGSRRDMGFWYNKRLIVLFRIINLFVGALIVNSCAIKLNTARREIINSKKIHVIYNGVDIIQSSSNLYNVTHSRNECTEIGDFKVGKQYQSDVNQKHNIICFGKHVVNIGIAANFSRRVKRVDIFIRAAKLVLDHFQEVEFVIAGGGYLEKELKSLAVELAINDKVHFVGVQADIYALIKNWHIGVITSDSEGFCNAIIEYMVAGLPVVATDVGGNPELVENNLSGFLVPPNDPVALSNKLLTLIKDSDLRNKMGNRGRTIVQDNYLWSKIIVDIDKTYKKLFQQFA